MSKTCCDADAWATRKYHPVGTNSASIVPKGCHL